MSGIRRNLNGPYAQGVPNPYVAHVHPYPTRFHGGIWTRPVFGTPFVMNPASVFKPDDFYEYYGVKGIGGVGSFEGSSLGGSSLGLGATGGPIYYLASSVNPKVSTLQAGLNKVLGSNGFPQIPVTGKMDAKTCAALSIAITYDRTGLSAQVPEEIITEASKTCLAAVSTAPIVKTQIAAAGDAMIKARVVVTQPLLSPTAVMPSDSVSIVQVATTPQAQPPLNTPPTPAIVPPTIVETQVLQKDQPLPNTPVMETAQQSISIPEMSIEAQPPSKSAVASNKMLLIGLAAAALGAAYLLTRKK